MKKKRRQSNKQAKITFTKITIKWILVVALIDIQLPFILAFLGKEQIAEDLGKLIVTEIIGVFFTYCLKSFFETREEKRNEMLVSRGIDIEDGN